MRVLALVFTCVVSTACSSDKRGLRKEIPSPSYMQDNATGKDASTSGAEGPLSINAASTVEAFTKAVGTTLTGTSHAEWQLNAGKDHKHQRLAWLAKDFSAPVFRRAIAVDEALLQTRTSEGPLHTAVWIVHFHDCESVNAASAGVLKVQRLNFRIPVLTVFRTLRKRKSLVFLVSETPMHLQVQKLFNLLDTQRQPSEACTD